MDTIKVLPEANEILETIYQRRAVRKYKDKTVSRAIIEQILDAGRMAPSAINKQPWKFHVLTDKSQILSFSGEIARVAEKLFHLSHGVSSTQTDDFIFHGAPVVIFITAPKDDDWAQLDIGMCAENIMLAAKSLGLDTCPIGLAKFVEQTPVYPQLSIPVSEKICVAIILGYGDEQIEEKVRKKNNIFFIWPVNSV